jgi:hypothetical protein
MMKENDIVHSNFLISYNRKELNDKEGVYCVKGSSAV